MNKTLPKFYYLKDMTQEDLNELVLERNILASKNNVLQKENNCLWERIKYLLTSRTVRMYDEVDPITKKHKFDISDLDNLQQRIDKAIEYIEKIQKSEKNINPYILHAPTLLRILKGDNND